MTAKTKTKRNKVEKELTTAINGVLTSHKIPEKKFYKKDVRPFSKDLAKKIVKLIKVKDSEKTTSKKVTKKPVARGRKKR